MNDCDFNVLTKANEYETIYVLLLLCLDISIKYALNERRIIASDTSSIVITGGGNRVRYMKKVLGNIIG